MKPEVNPARLRPSIAIPLRIARLIFMAGISSGMLVSAVVGLVRVLDRLGSTSRAPLYLGTVQVEPIDFGFAPRCVFEQPVAIDGDTLTIENSGPSPLTIGDAILCGTESDTFHLGGHNITLEPNGAMDVRRVANNWQMTDVFQPSQSGDYRTSKPQHFIIEPPLSIVCSIEQHAVDGDFLEVDNATKIPVTIKHLCGASLGGYAYDFDLPDGKDLVLAPDAVALFEYHARIWAYKAGPETSVTTQE